MFLSDPMASCIPVRSDTNPLFGERLNTAIDGQVRFGKSKDMKIPVPHFAHSDLDHQIRGGDNPNQRLLPTMAKHCELLFFLVITC